MFLPAQSSIKKALVCFMLLILAGCSTAVKSANTVSSTSNKCPDRPEGSLSSDRVKSIYFGSQTVKETGVVSPGKDQGYAFEANAGQRISYRTNQNICTWVFTPNNEIVNSTNLPLDGKYTMQVAALTGSTTFEIEMGLGELERVSKNYTFQSTSANSSAPQRYQFSSSDFPKTSCGDPLPSDSRDYPVTFYPVFIPYNETNLDKARSLFCQDALKVRRKDTQEIAIQVASFTNEEKSKDFANFVNSEISDAEVGQPTVRTLNLNE
ncbi:MULTISPECIES: hypothetical protein [Chroococcidiopsis]|jgi:hypothetical protein|uniref:Lipoprotein n=1 Tax=Chroococcidiopsis thermalis (strain PCC 7203) TaxID=251229 RepID=K9U3G2_CHRTP|nr:MULTISPECIES: hypothetical protein [Chroococcidiopsis]AFY89345.1 hypothetical protein Chro_3936 [Chroococcidiopsis thermalis PCC 7203]URD48717.1 hypothetical protein M5J74_20565 [Chroococcidiopsis sp. CCNUC1]